MDEGVGNDDDELAVGDSTDESPQDEGSLSVPRSALSSLFASPLPDIVVRAIALGSFAATSDLPVEFVIVASVSCGEYFG